MRILKIVKPDPGTPGYKFQQQYKRALQGRKYKTFIKKGNKENTFYSTKKTLFKMVKLLYSILFSFLFFNSLYGQNQKKMIKQYFLSKVLLEEGVNIMVDSIFHSGMNEKDITGPRVDKMAINLPDSLYGLYKEIRLEYEVLNSNNRDELYETFHFDTTNKVELVIRFSHMAFDSNRRYCMLYYEVVNQRNNHGYGAHVILYNIKGYWFEIISSVAWRQEY